MFKGAYSYTDLQNMTEYEIMLITEAYKDIKETERIAIEPVLPSDNWRDFNCWSKKGIDAWHL